MSRGLTSAITTEIDSGRTRPAVFVKAEFDSGDLRLWTGKGELTWDSQTWTGAGNLLSIETIEETEETVARGARVRLNGMPAAILALAYSEEYQGRPCTIWMGFLDDNRAVIADPFILFRGSMDVIEDQEDGETATFILSVENALIALEKAPERTYTHEDQQELFPGDTCFIQMPDIVNLEIELE